MENDIYKWHFEIDLQDVQSEDYYDNLERYGEHENTCLLCGKRIKNEQQHVRLLTNGSLVSHLEELDNCQGLFYVGNDCKKKLPNNFVFKANQ